MIIPRTVVGADGLDVKLTDPTKSYTLTDINGKMWAVGWDSAGFRWLGINTSDYSSVSPVTLEGANESAVLEAINAYALAWKTANPTVSRLSGVKFTSFASRIDGFAAPAMAPIFPTEESEESLTPTTPALPPPVEGTVVTPAGTVTVEKKSDNTVILGVGLLAVGALLFMKK
jgi:hypothetical protein